MVGEFPELQGLMGGYYAAAQGEAPAVAEAIRDHYKPVGQGDDVPTAPVTVAVSLADKLDTVFAFLAINEPPSGSRDPYALRRQVLGVIRTLLQNNLRLHLRDVCAALAVFHEERYAIRMADDVPGLDELLNQYFEDRPPCNQETFEKLETLVHQAIEQFLESVPEHPEVPGDAFNRPEQQRRISAMHRSFIPRHVWFTSWAEVVPVASNLSAFAGDRLKVQQREAGVRHDLIDAVFALGGEDDLVRLLARVHALQSFVATEDGANLLAGYKRAANILKKEDYVAPAKAGAAGLSGDDGSSNAAAPASAGATLSYTPEPAEADLIAALDAAGPAAADAVANEDFEAAMAALATLRAPIDAFFDAVTVNDADPVKRAARLALLARVRDAVHGVADFSKIEG